MIPVLSREEMRAFDAHAIGVARVPSLVLMENAGRGVADVVMGMLGAERSPRVVVLCGAGNNGGDGFVAARHLVTRGCAVDVHLASSAASLRGDARVHHDALAGLGVPIHGVAEELGPVRASLEGASLVVDALFGTGLDRPLAGHHAALVSLLNSLRRRVVAVDIPSGMNADTGQPMGVAVEAACTVTFALHKLGLLTPKGAELAGDVRVADIGVPTSLAAKVGHAAWLLTPSDVGAALGRRAVGAHKGTTGHVAVFAGSSGKPGAALLSSRSALRAGAGLVTLASWPEAMPALEGRVLEIMTELLDRDALGASVDRVLAGKRAVVVGPGFGTDEAARAVVLHLLANFKGPLVIDADALALFEGRPEAFASCAGSPVLTPHPGELAKLLSRKTAEIEGDRFAALRDAVARTGAVVVLKGAHTLVGGPGERPIINATGNPALATAGAGDVLSGILGAMLCRSSPLEAAWSAVHVHGRAADAWRDAHGDRGLLAHEVADGVPAVIEALSGAHGHCPA